MAFEIAQVSTPAELGEMVFLIRVAANGEKTGRYTVQVLDTAGNVHSTQDGNMVGTFSTALISQGVTWVNALIAAAQAAILP